MLNNILPDFQKFLTSCGIVGEKHVHFYGAVAVSLKISGESACVHIPGNIF